jgi:hypothetical protein
VPKKKMTDTPKEQVEQIRACVVAVPGDVKGLPTFDGALALLCGRLETER